MEQREFSPRASVERNDKNKNTTQGLEPTTYRCHITLKII
jgi:hypothetical protein